MTAHENIKKVRRRLHEILEVGHIKDVPSIVFDIFIITLIVANVVAFLAETVSPLNIIYARAFEVFNLVSVVIFTLEYLVRLWCAVESVPLRHLNPWHARARFASNPLMVIDLLAVLPFYLGSIFGLDLRILRILRLLRFLKLARYSPALDTLRRVIVAESRALFGALLVMLFLLLFASSGIYFLERALQPEHFGSIPASAWWAVSTLTTVGYGDVVPVTVAGKILGGVMMIFGLGMFALPIGIIATGFSQEIHRREFVVTWSTVASVPIFHDLDAATIAEIVALLRARSYVQGGLIMRKGDTADEMYFIVSGTVEIEADGGSFTLGAADYFGEMALLEKRVRSANALAHTKCNLLILESGTFEYLMRRNPVLAEKMLVKAKAREAENALLEQAAEFDGEAPDVESIVSDEGGVPTTDVQAVDRDAEIPSEIRKHEGDALAEIRNWSKKDP